MNESVPHILYLITFYGTPPLNYLERYINEENAAKITIVKLPTVRPTKNRLHIDAFLKSNLGEYVKVDISIWFPFPIFVYFITHYILNTLIFCYLILRSKKNFFSIVIGEASFGGALAYLLGRIGFAKYSVYMNGDSLPERKSRKKPFYFSSSGTIIAKVVDEFLINTQYFFRGLGIKTDLVWYPNERVLEWDKRHFLFAKDYLVFPNIMVDYEKVMEGVRDEKKGNRWEVQ